MATSAWGVPSGPSAWASQVEDEEVSGGQLGPTSAAPVLGGDDAFPSLGEVGKVSKKDKRKGKKMSLSELQGMGSTARGSAFVPSAARQQASEPEFSLPTGPREHREDEEPRRGGFGGAGFRGQFTLKIILTPSAWTGLSFHSCCFAQWLVRSCRSASRQGLLNGHF